jgi:site-specific recombinase XerD
MKGLKFYIKTSKNDKSTDIYLRITAFGKSEMVYTGFKVKPSCWCTDKSSPYYQRVIIGSSEIYSREINRELDNLINLSLKAIATFGKVKPTSAQIKNKILEFLHPEGHATKTSQPQTTFFEFFEKHIEITSLKINPRTQNKITIHTSKSMRQTLSLLRRFEKKTRYKIDFETINLGFYHRFTKYCEQFENYRTNTFGKHIKNIKVILNSAEIQGYNISTEYRHSDFRSTTEQTTSIYLSESEIQCLIDLDLSETPGYERTRDLFVIGCYTGLRFGDYSQLNNVQAINNERISIRTQKTKKLVVIPILNPIKHIFDKFFNAKSKTYVFPKQISNQKFNKQLKIIASKIGVLNQNFEYSSRINGKEVVETYKKWQMVCTHTARRSFATNMYLRGIKPLLIMKITGHLTEKEFYKYIKIDPDDNADEFLDEFNSTS